MKKLFGYVCDNCKKFFVDLVYSRQGKKRKLHFCNEECLKKESKFNNKHYKKYRKDTSLFS